MLSSLPTWLAADLTALSGLLAMLNSVVAKDDERALCSRAAVDWDLPAGRWGLLWSPMRDDVAYQPANTELDSLDALTSKTKRIAPHLPEHSELLREAYAQTTLVVAGAV
jgi:hypothetical protein